MLTLILQWFTPKPGTGRHALGNVRPVPADYSPLPYALRCRIRARLMRSITDKYLPVLIEGC